MEVGSEIHDDGVGEAEPVQDLADEVDYSVRGLLCDHLVLDPLCELVDGYQHISKTS
jgi:hypothetical protein